MFQKLVLFLYVFISSPITGVVPTAATLSATVVDAPSCDAPALDASERAEMRRQIDTVARELGASPLARRLLVRWAVRESRAMPATRHMMEADRAAASSPRARKAILAMGRVWSPNTWGHGRGLYGMQPAFYLPRWNASADPDVLCDPIVATITAVWAARDHARECKRAGFAPTVVVASRRWGSGHCDPRERDADVAMFWESRGVDADATVSWGRRWPEESADRREIYQHMIRKLGLADRSLVW